MHLFYAPDIGTGIYTLNEIESRHCIKVLRLSAGDTIHLADGEGTLIEARLADPNPKACMVEIVKTTQNFGKRPYSLHIGIAPTKNISRLEWFLEKATEIGIDEITPVICDHSERKVVKTDRLNKIITSAVKQSLKAYHPVLNEPVAFSDVIVKRNEASAFIAYIDDKFSTSLKDACRPGDDMFILIGPEGDFSPGEVELARNHGFIPVSLGQSRLRTETAGVVACHTIALMNE